MNASEGGTSFTVVDSTNLPICYNRSGAEVIVHVSFLADCLTEFSQLLECQLERFRYLVDWLDGLNGEWLVDVCLRIKRLKSRLSAHKVLQLSKTAADSGTIAFDFSILSACTEFQSVPIQCSQLRDFLVRSTKWEKPNFVGEISYLFVCEQRDMPNNFMNNIWFRCILRIWRMTDVLSGTEDSVCKSVQKLTLTEYSVGWSDAELSLGTEVLVKLTELWNSPWEVKLPLQPSDLVLEAFAHRLFMQLTELIIAVSPDSSLFLGILNEWNRLAHNMELW